MKIPPDKIAPGLGCLPHEVTFIDGQRLETSQISRCRPYRLEDVSASEMETAGDEQ